MRSLRSSVAHFVRSLRSLHRASSSSRLPLWVPPRNRLTPHTSPASSVAPDSRHRLPRARIRARGALTGARHRIVL